MSMTVKKMLESALCAHKVRIEKIERHVSSKLAEAQQLIQGAIRLLEDIDTTKLPRVVSYNVDRSIEKLGRALELIKEVSG